MLLRVLRIACITSAARVEVQADATTAEVREIDFALISAAADGNAVRLSEVHAARDALMRAFVCFAR